MTRQTKAGTTNVSVVIRIIDSTDGTPETGVVWNTSGIDLQYRREGAASVAITEATLSALTDAHSDGGFLHIGNGYYRLDLPDAATAAGATGVLIHGTVTGMVVIGEYIQLVAYDEQDAVRLGLTALPNAAADAAGGLPISDAGGLDMDTLLGYLTGNVALASVVGALTDSAADGDPTTGETLMQYIKQLINILVGSAGVVTFPAEAAPANAVSLAEIIRAIHTDVTGLNGDAMRGTDSAFLAASAPTNFSDLSVTATTGRVDVASIEGSDATDQINAAADTALTDYDAPTYDELLAFVQLLARSDAAITTDRATELNAINANQGSGAGDYAGTTESNEALRDHIGDGTNLPEAGGDGDHLTAINLPNQTMDITGNITGNLSGSVGSVTGNVGGNVTGSVGSVLGGLNTTAGTITTLDGLDTAQDSQHSTTQAAITALNDIAVSDILTTQITEAYAADGVAPTIAQALMLIQQQLGEFSISGTTLTVKKLDGSTTAATFTLDDASTPTSLTRAS